jgi:hypothetical protein
MPRFRTSAFARARAGAAAALLLTTGLVVTALAVGPSEAAPSGTAPPALVLSPPKTDNLADLVGAPTEAIPAVLAQKNLTPITTTLTVSDLSELTKGTVINLTAVKIVGGVEQPAGGTFTPSSVTVGSRTTSVPISVTYSQAASDVIIRAALKKSTSTSPTPGLSEPFDVVDSLLLKTPTADELANGFGASDCTSASLAKVCGFVILPNGITSTKAALSRGVCAVDEQCSAEEVQFIAGLDGEANRTTPATLVLRCDKTKCGGKGVSNYTARISLLKSGAFVDSPACPAKDTLPPLSTLQPGDPGYDPNQGHFCTDYTSSHRDNAGDLLLEVLFDKDMRGTM